MRNQASGQSISEQQSRFARAPSVDIQRSSFDRSYNHRSTFDEGQLIPFLVDEILPGDTVELNTTIVVRMSTPKFPLMSLLWLTTHYFFVPNRIIWQNWKAFQGEQLDPGTDITTHVIPQVPSPVGGWTAFSMGDYFGLPTLVERDVNALPFRAFNAIYNAWYRDEDITDHAVVNTGAGPDQATWFPIRYRAKRHDYFTSARPWPIKGGTEVTLPLGSEAKVHVAGVATSVVNVYSDTQDAARDLDADQTTVELDSGLTTASAYLYANLDTATAASISDLRLAITMQQALELDGRSGTRYTEALRARWKVTSPDFRLQRPEYIGGGRQAINVTQVATTSDNAGGDIGDLGGFAYSAGSDHRASYTATEHGQLIGIVSIMGDNEYQEGFHKMWDRTTRWDFYEPVFANLGEQEILKGELFADGTSTDLETWAYQERWAEYRYKPSVVSGAFRSEYAQSLDSWHTAEHLESIPGLADEFILTSSDSPNVGRCILTPGDPHFLFDSMTKFKHTRAMPMYSVPGLTRL